MPDCMSFPDNIMDFIDDYSFEDSDYVYTNGSKLISTFRVKQAVEHYFREQEPVAPVCTEYDRAIVLFSCRDCKTQLLYGQRYCHMCGRKVKWDGT